MTRAVQILCISDSLCGTSIPHRHYQQWGNPEDCRGRNNSPGSPRSTFAARSVAQLPTLTGRLQMEVLMQHLRQKHGGQVLLEDSVGQLRWLNRQACVY